jgi:peptidoglycan hydrolase-like protein with peptidoglycan-binding domain
MASNLLGEKGVRVAQVQALLQRLNYYIGPVDGTFNFSLATAIREYQEALGITPQATLGDGSTGWGIWDEVTDNATNYLVHYLSSGTKWWQTDGGEVGWDPSKTIPEIANPTLPSTEGPAQREQESTQQFVPPPTEDAIARMESWLSTNFGLTGLKDFAKRWLEEGWEEEEGYLELENTEAFRARFPAIFERRASGLPPINAYDYVKMERDYAQTLTRAGITNFFDNKSLMNSLIANDVSKAEFDERVLGGFRRVVQSSPEVRDAFAAYFGVDGDTALAAYFMDPDNLADKLAQQVEAAGVGGMGTRFGFSVNRDRSMELVKIGVDERQAQSGFAKLQELEPVFAETLGETEDLTAMGEGVDAMFQTGMPGVRLIEGRVRSRTNMLSGQSDAMIDQTGILGFGTDS